MTSYNVPVASASASSVNSAGYEAYRAFNGIVGTPAGQRWASASNVPQWLKADLGTAKVVDYYAIVGGGFGANQDPAAWTFEGSNDNSTWTTLDTRTGQSFGGTLTPNLYTFTNTTAYRYYRLNISALGGTGGTIVSISEMSLGTASGATSMTTPAVCNLDNVTSNTMTLATTPGPDDVVIVSIVANRTDVTVSGLGATWVETRADAAIDTRYHSIWRGTAATSSGTITVTAGGAVNAQAVSFLIVNGDGTVMNGVAHTALMTGAANGQVALSVVSDTSTGSPALDTTNTTPASTSWGQSAKFDPTAGGHFRQAWRVVDAAGSYRGQWAGLVLAGAEQNLLGMPAPAVASSPTGTVQATLPALTANVAGTVTSPTTGSVGATLPALTASIQGTVPASVSGAVAATLPRLSAQISAGNPPLGTFALNAKASLTASLPTITLVPLTVSLAAKASLSVATRAVKMFAFDLEAKADLRVTLPRHQTVDPVTGLPQYRLLAVTQDGTAVGELPRAAIGEHTTGLGLDDERLTFTLPKYDAGNRIVTARKGDPVREVQLWRGPNLEAWVKVDGDRPGDGVTEYDCSSLAGYLKGRVVGRTPKTDWLVNGDFSNGEYGWSFGFEAGSVPAAAPTHEVVDVDFFGKASKALKLGGSDVVTQIQAEVKTAAVFAPNSATYVSGGEAKIQAAGANIPNGTDVHIVGYTAYNWLDGDYGDGLTLSLNRARAARATLAAMGKGFTFSIDPALPTPNVKDTSLGVAGRGRYGALNGNNTYAEQEQNRRVVFSYAGTVTFDADAAQYAQGSLVVGTVTVPVSEKRGLPIAFRGWAWLDSIVKKSRAGYGVYIQIAKASAPDVIVEEAHSTLDETSPVQVWERHRAEVTVPPDGLTYIYTARLYAPKGAVLWTAAGVYPAEALHFPGVDRALIVKGLVEHAQDPAMGKLGDTPILIGTRTPLTGKTLTRTYPFYERRQILDAVAEHTAVFDGVDISMDHLTRQIVTHFPWRGQRSGVTFELGSNISAYEAPTSVTDARTRAITQGLESSGADREEGIVTDMTGLGGVLIEGLNYAEPETPVTELEASSQSAIVRNGHPVTDLTVTIGRVGAWDPALTSWMLDHVGVGDIVDVVIIDGTVNIVGPHRVIRRTLTPDTDTLRYALAPEPEEA